jgi:DUF917 family protein
MVSVRLLAEADIEDIAVGATVLGTGGGGDPYLGKLMAINAIKQKGPVKLLSLKEIPDDALIVSVAMMGSPVILLEKLPKGDEALKCLSMIEAKVGKKVFAVASAEAGGVNSTIPLAAGAQLGLPVVDGDGMGRAFPEIQMVSYHLYGIRASPFAMSDEKGNSVLLDTISNKWIEWISRAVTVAMGGSAIIALYKMTGKEYRKACVPNTLSFAQKIGETIRLSKKNRQDPVENLLKLVHGFKLFKGKIIDVSRRTTGGFARGEAIIEGIDEFKGSKLKLNFQNENLIAIRDEKVVATVPDLITLLECETGLPVTTEGLKYGYRVFVTGIPCNPVWRTPKGIENVGPRYFGYDVDYKPVEELIKR